MKTQNVPAGLLTLSAVCISFFASAQSFVDSLAQDKTDILGSIAPYQEDVRLSILNVSQYPQALVKLERIQARTSQSFEDMVSAYPREDQERLYEISRFPDLVYNLTRNGKLSQDEVRPLLKDFPDDFQTRILQVNENHYGDLVKMHKLYESSENAFNKIIASYPSSIQNDFRKVVGMPEVMDLLTENINLTVMLGEEYKSHPQGIRQQVDSMSAQLARKNETALAAYKKDVESDPKLQQEMKAAATDFSAAYDQPDNPVYVTNNYIDNYPYPYWFSYPYWYSMPMWYPRPMYYNTGFYFGRGGNIVVVGLPSHLYANWFYGFGYRRYPYLYVHYNNYYAFHRNNVYRGFNNAAYNHGVERNIRSHTRGNYEAREGANTIRRSVRTSTTNSRNGNINRQARESQMTVNPGRFNNQGIQRYHATTYHGLGWQSVGRGRQVGGAMRSGGGIRSGGSGGRSGGGLPGGGGGRGHR